MLFFFIIKITFYQQGGVLPSQQQMGGMQYNYQPNSMYQQQPSQVSLCCYTVLETVNCLTINV